MGRVLVIDDDYDILNLVEILLRNAGYTVFTADCAHKGTEVLEIGNIDLIITDLNMPGFSGFDLINRLKKRKIGKDIPIAMLTSDRELQNIQKAIELGVSDYIVKPIDPLLFIKKVKLLTKSEDKQNLDQQIPQEVNFPHANAEAEAHIHFPIRVQTVSEMGLQAISSKAFKPNEILNIDFKLFADLNIKTPPFKVVSCEEADDAYVLILSFVGVHENIRQKLRSWIYNQTLKRSA